MNRNTLTVRAATQEELDRTGAAEHANLGDGAGAVLADGRLVAITNEYNSVVWNAAADDVDELEKVSQAAWELIATERPGTTA